MSTMIALASVVLIVLVLRTRSRRCSCPAGSPATFRFARLFYVYSWTPWAAAPGGSRPGKRRNTFLSLFGPLSILVLIGALGGRADRRVRPAALVARHAARQPPDETAGLGIYAYFSGVTFFTLGYGDVTPVGPLGRLLAVAEAGLGLRLPRRGHQLPAGPLPGVLAPRGDDLAARRPRRLAADGRAAAAPAGPAATSPRSTGSWRSGSGGRPRCWRATSRSRS